MHASGNYTLGNAFARGFELFKNRYGLVLGISLVVVLVSALPALLMTPINLIAIRNQQNAVQVSSAIPLLQLAGQCFQIIWSFLVATPLSIGGLWVLIRILRGQTDVRFADITTPYRRLGWVIVAQLLLSAVLIAVVLVTLVIVGLIVFVLALLTGLVMQGSPSAMPFLIVTCFSIGGPLMALMIYYPTVRVVGMMILVIDDAYGLPDPAAALTLAWQGTRGHGWSLVGLVLLLGLIMLGTVLLFCIGLPLLGLPFYMATLAASYMLLYPGRIDPDEGEMPDEPPITW